ncbi:MAG: response regulator [Aliarcobacter sp.]|nr:response regulator [Aliarcobacter sp.]
MSDFENLKNYTILYVEDEKESVELIQTLLKTKIKTIFVAYDGVEGLELYKKHLPDIVISDIQMPNMNGIEMAKEIKKLNPKQNIIFITAFNENNLLLEAINLGIDKYIIKPILSLESLLNPIDTICKVLSYDTKLKIEERIEAMELILKTISHHWRQPLNLLSLESSAMLFNLETDNTSKEKLTKELTEIVHTTQALSLMIDDFITMFSSSISTHTKNFSLIETVENAIEILENEIISNNITIINHTKEIFMNQNQILFEQIILNLLTNSIEAIIENQEDIEKRYILIETKKGENKDFIFSILDSGKGIDELIKDKIFEPYFSRKKVHSGSGMGLFITNKILKNQFNTELSTQNEVFMVEDKKLYGAKMSVHFFNIQ